MHIRNTNASRRSPLSLLRPLQLHDGDCWEMADLLRLWAMRTSGRCFMLSQIAANWLKMGMKVPRMFTQCFPNAPGMGKL